LKGFTLPQTNMALKIDGWKMNFLLGWPLFRCYVCFREGTAPKRVVSYRFFSEIQYWN